MGKSFFRGTDAALYTGSAAFAAQISADPSAYGLQPADAEAYASLNATFAAAYLAAKDPSTRCTHRARRREKRFEGAR